MPTISGFYGIIILTHLKNKAKLFKMRKTEKYEKLPPIK